MENPYEHKNQKRHVILSRTIFFYFSLDFLAVMVCQCGKDNYQEGFYIDKYILIKKIYPFHFYLDTTFFKFDVLKLDWTH